MVTITTSRGTALADASFRKSDDDKGGMKTKSLPQYLHSDIKVREFPPIPRADQVVSPAVSPGPNKLPDGNKAMYVRVAVEELSRMVVELRPSMRLNYLRSWVLKNKPRGHGGWNALYHVLVPPEIFAFG